MTLNETIDRLKTTHLMVRDASEWDGLATALTEAYRSGDDDLIEQLQPPYLQSWRTVTHYVLRDALDAAGISVTEPSQPWGIATLTANGVSREPLLCHGNLTVSEESAVLTLFTFAETMAYYAECLEPLLEPADAHQEQFTA